MNSIAASAEKDKLMIAGAEYPAQLLPLTIAIPTYNRAGSVFALIQSICEQIESCDEVLVSDDCSTDGTTELVGTIANVRIIRQNKNQGMVGNWNVCLAEATRDWICIVHDDDRLGAGALSALRHACALAKGPALVLHRYRGPQFDNGFRYTFSEPSPGSVLSCPTIPSGAVIHRTIVKEVGLFNPHFTYSSDLEYFPRIAAKFPSIVIESPRIIDYRLHQTNHQFETWRKTDFFSQYEELQLSVLSHAGIQDEPRRREALEKRTIPDLFYMLDMADRIGDKPLVRKIGRYCERFRHSLSVRQTVMAKIASITGRRPRRRRAQRLDPI